MEKIHQAIWEKALPYQDKRKDKGHAKVVLHYAQKLLKVTTKANPAIVIPAVILHDIGWSQLPKTDRMLIFKFTDGVSHNRERHKVRRWHEREGVKLAKMILEKIKYPKQYRSEILKIINGHDSTKGTFSINDSLMRDADKLWRYSKLGFWSDLRKKTVDNTTHLANMKELVPILFFTEQGMKFAKQELKYRTAEIDKKFLYNM